MLANTTKREKHLVFSERPSGADKQISWRILKRQFVFRSDPKKYNLSGRDRKLRAEQALTRELADLPKENK